MKFHTLFLSGLVVLTATVAAYAQDDPPVPGLVIMRVQVGESIEAAIAYMEPMLPAVTFTVVDDALASRRVYLLGFTPAALGPQVEIMLDMLDTLDPDDPANPIDYGERLYANHDPEGNSGSIWFQSISGIDQFSNQYVETMLGLGPAQVRSTGQGVVVAVIDTGIDATHPLLADVIAPGGFNFVSDSTDTSDVGDGIDNDGDKHVDESVGHGTFVASLIHLTAPDATLLPVVVLNSDGIGDAWRLTRGIYHAIDRGVEVINLSLGSTYSSDAVRDAIKDARNLGIFVPVAGGNLEPSDPGPIEENPATQSNMLGVAAVDSLGSLKADFSNYDSKFFISAPGASVADAGAPDGFDPSLSIYGAVPGGNYGIWQGTSFATAFVSGAAALVRAQHPEWHADETTWQLVEAVLEGTAVNIDAQNPDFAGQLGAGRLDIAAATTLGPIAPTLGDLDNNGTVGILDMLTLFEAWGQVHSSADLDGDGVVGITDFLILLANWGPSRPEGATTAGRRLIDPR